MRLSESANPESGVPREAEARPGAASSRPPPGVFTRPLNLPTKGHSIESKVGFQMKTSFALFLLVAAGFAAYAQQQPPAAPPAPHMVSVEPGNGKAGDVLTVTGENLQKELVVKVYLYDGKNDIQCEVTEQTEKTIKFKIPAKATGRLALEVLTSGKEPKLMEQGVKVTVE